jgi:hypothetical protein
VVAKVIGLDPGKSNVATWVVHSAGAQAVHRRFAPSDGIRTDESNRYEGGTLYGGEWRFLSGQTQYTAKVKKRVAQFCPGVHDFPSVKTCSVETLLRGYASQVAQWENMERCFFDESWYQKQRFKLFVKTQKALETVVSRVLGTRNKQEQKRVIVAYGDGDMSRNMPGLSPLLSTKFFKKMQSSATVAVVNEFKTSELCSCCRETMRKMEGRYRVLCCDNSNCIRTVWNRDINAAINILNIFLHLCVTGTRPEEFRRRRRGR